MKRIITWIAIVLSLPLSGQQADWQYSFQGTANLSSSALVVTLQQPASGGRNVRLRALWITNDTATSCGLTLEKNGTAATGAVDASASIQSDNDFNPAAVEKVYTASNVGAGAVTWPYTIPASGRLDVDLSGLYLLGSGTGKNFTLRTESCIVNLKYAFIYTAN